MSRATVLGIDLGSQSVKVVLYDADARDILAVECAPLDLFRTDSGVAEQQAQWWIHALRQALQQVDKGVKKSVAAIGVSGQQHGFVPIDKSGEVLGQVKLWCDTSTGAECDAIMEAFGGIDNMMGAIGTSNVVPGVVTVSLGTSGTVYAYSDEPIIDPKGSIAAENGEPVPVSGRQELVENLINDYIVRGC